MWLPEGSNSCSRSFASNSRRRAEGGFFTGLAGDPTYTDQGSQDGRTDCSSGASSGPRTACYACPPMRSRSCVAMPPLLGRRWLVGRVQIVSAGILARGQRGRIGRERARMRLRATAGGAA